MTEAKSNTVLVTGGASGIGLAITSLFLSKGWKVIVLDYDKQGGEELEENKKKLGLPFRFIHGDVSDADSIQEALAGTEFIDALVNNAGISHVGNIMNTTAADFDRIYQINVKGIFNCTAAVMPLMLERKKGVIINMCSIAATIGLADRFAYSMSKGAVLSMTLSLARDFVDQGIRCNCISPGRVHTPFVDGFITKNYPGKEKEMFAKLAASQPIGRMGKPEEVAALVYYLCSDDATFITGSNFPIDGGFIGLKM